MTAEPLAYGLLRSAERSAAHMEMRDAYTPDDPDWLDWQAATGSIPQTGGPAGPAWSAPRWTGASACGACAWCPSR